MCFFSHIYIIYIFLSVDLFIFRKGDRRKLTCIAENLKTTNSAPPVRTHLVKYVGCKIFKRK